jgi:threonine aldolase
MNICLTKGIGASVGAILINDTGFIKHAKWVRKSIGCAMRQPGWVAAAAWASVNSVFGLNPNGTDSLMRESHAQSYALADHWVQRGGKLVVPQQTNMVWLDLNAAGIDEEEWEILGREAELKLHSSRIITHFRKHIEPTIV